MVAHNTSTLYNYLSGSGEFQLICNQSLSSIIQQALARLLHLEEKFLDTSTSTFYCLLLRFCPDVSNRHREGS